MKKIFVFLCSMMLILSFTGMAAAYTYSWSPTPVDLYDLDHHNYYTWGIEWQSIIGHTSLITQASLSIENINDWIVEDGDILYIHLLDDPMIGVTEGTDNQASGDAFDGMGILLTTYTDSHTGPNPSEDFDHVFVDDQFDTLINYLNNNGLFGFGFDPDCHYLNDGITFTIETSAPIPEPTTMLLLGSGLIGLAAFGRKKFFKK